MNLNSHFNNMKNINRLIIIVLIGFLAIKCADTDNQEKTQSVVVEKNIFIKPEPLGQSGFTDK